MSLPSYIKEVTNNAIHARFYLNRYRHVDILCVWGKLFYRYSSALNLNIISGNTLCCHECNVNSMIPITPGSRLYDMEHNERQKLINDWHEEWFSELEDEPEYEDYEYSDEETKEPYSIDNY